MNAYLRRLYSPLVCRLRPFSICYAVCGTNTEEQSKHEDFQWNISQLEIVNLPKINIHCGDLRNFGVQTCFPICSLSPTLQLAGLNNLPQEGSQLCQRGKENSCTPGTAQSLTFRTDWQNVMAAARHQGGWTPLAEHPWLCWTRAMPDHCKKFLELNFFFLGGAWTGPHRSTTRTSSCNALGLEQPQRELSLLSNPACSQTLENIRSEKNVALPNIPSLDTIPQS